MTTDAVCGMKVDNRRPVMAYEYKGRIYYFCSAGCRDEFSYDPEKYIEEGTSKGAELSNHSFFEGKGAMGSSPALTPNDRHWGRRGD